MVVVVVVPVVNVVVVVVVAVVILVVSIVWGTSTIGGGHAARRAVPSLSLVLQTPTIYRNSHERTAGFYVYVDQAAAPSESRRRMSSSV